MIHREATVENLARAMLVVAVLASMTMALSTGANYLKYLRWTSEVKASLVSASIKPHGTSGELYMDIRFTAPAVGYRAEIQSVEFTLKGAHGDVGSYRIVVPEGITHWDEHGVTAEMALYSEIHKEHWPDVRSSRWLQVDGRLVVRLYLPGRVLPARVPLTGDVDMGGAR